VPNGQRVILAVLALVFGALGVFGLINNAQPEEQDSPQDCVSWVMAEHPENPDPLAVCARMETQ
jgi:hypothetical protein